MLFRKGRAWAPNDSALKELIIGKMNDTIVASRIGMGKTIEMISRNSYWPHIAEEIGGYVRSCDDCPGNKASRHQRYGMLHPFELSHSPWDSISINFITHFPVSALIMAFTYGLLGRWRWSLRTRRPRFKPVG